MDAVLKNLIGTEVYVFIDDLTVFSKTAEEHAQRLENVLQRLDRSNLQLHPGKCVFGQPQVHYLGFVLLEKRVSVSPVKTKAVRNYPTPKSAKDVRAYLGLVSFYRRLIPDSATITKPLTELTKEDRPFVWGQGQQKALEGLKDKLCKAPVLAYANFNLPFILITDALN